MTTGRPPLLAHVLAGLAAALVVGPLVAIAVRVPWSEAGSILSSPAIRRVLVRSLATSLAATLIVAVLGIPLAWVLARSAFPGRALLRAMTTVPLVLPPVVGGVALLLAFGRRGLAGPALAAFGIRIPFTTAAVVMAQAFVALPFLVVTLETALLGLDPAHEEAAATLGARPWFTFRRVTLPISAPSLLAGLVLAWVRAVGEFGATITFAGAVAGRTASVEVYLALERGDLGAASVLSVALLVVSVAVLGAVRRRWLPT